MTAANKKIAEDTPGDIEALLPWHAAGTLNARDTRRVEEALSRDPALATQYAVIRDEYAETISLNENLGAPSARAMQKLFAATDAEPPQSGATKRSRRVRKVRSCGPLPSGWRAMSASTRGQLAKVRGVWTNRRA